MSKFLTFYIDVYFFNIFTIRYLTIVKYQLIDFIKTETAKYENSGFSKKLTLPQNKD